MMCLISLLIHAKFEGNRITHFYFIAVFLQVCKKKEKGKKRKMKKMSNFLKAYILGMAGMIYFKSGMCSPMICQHLHSEFGFAWSRNHRAMNVHKIILCFSC